MQTTHTILVVDDTTDSRELAVFFLEAAGFAVIQAATGTEALAQARTAAPDAIVLDVHLPDLDGFEVCQRLKTDPSTRAIPVLFLSAIHVDLQARARGLRSGGDGYLTKPYESAELVSAVSNLVRLRDAEAALHTRDCLLAIARVVGGTTDMTEALRLVCRELARLTGAETLGAYLMDRERNELRPVAGYHVPERARRILATSSVPPQTFRPAVLEAGEVVWSDDVPADPRFAFDLFRAVPHRSGIVIPLVVDGELAGTVYLLWWEAARRVPASEAAMLQAIGRQVAVLVRNARLIEEAELRRRVAEAARQHYQRLFDRNLAGVFRITLSGRMIECNEAFARLLGHRTPVDAVRDDAWAVCADAAERDRLLTSLGRERRVTNYEARWRRVNGAEFTVMMNAIRIGDGGDALIEGIVLDVTEHRRAEDALREREAQLRALGNSLPDGVIYQVVRRRDGSNYFAYMSSGLERVFGISAEEAMRDASLVYRLVLPEDLQRIRAASDASILTGHPIDVEYRLRSAGGEVRWYNLRARPSPLEDGGTRWDAVTLDITDRRRTEEALREREARLAALTEGLRHSEARYRLLFERSFVGIFRSRSDGTVMDCNDAFARILGYRSAAEARGRSAVAHWATPAERDLVVARIAAGEEVVDTEVLGRRLDGTLFPLSLSVRRLDEEDGPVHEGVVLDLTDRKNAEEAIALRSVMDLAKAAAAETDDPLTTLLAQLAALERDGGSAEGLAETRAAILRIRDVLRHRARLGGAG